MQEQGKTTQEIKEAVLNKDDARFRKDQFKALRDSTGVVDLGVKYVHTLHNDVGKAKVEPA